MLKKFPRILAPEDQRCGKPGTEAVLSAWGFKNLRDEESPSEGVMRPSWSCSPRRDCHQVKKGEKGLAEVKFEESDLTLPGSYPGIYRLPALQPWASYLIGLGFSSLLHKMEGSVPMSIKLMSIKYLELYLIHSEHCVTVFCPCEQGARGGRR